MTYGTDTLLAPQAAAPGPADTLKPVHLIRHPATAMEFLLGGSSVFTLKSKKTGKHYTYKLTTPRRDGFSPRNKFARFVTLRVDNDFQYIGLLNENHALKTTRKSTMRQDSLPIQALNWAIANFKAGYMPNTLEFWHVGKCAACGLPLTNPESVERGFGPDCWKRQ